MTNIVVQEVADRDKYRYVSTTDDEQFPSLTMGELRGSDLSDDEIRELAEEMAELLIQARNQ